MEIVVFGWAQGRFIRIIVENLADEDGIEILGLPPGRSRAVRDRVYAALAHSETSLNTGLSVQVRPPIQAGATDDLDLAIFLAVREHLRRAGNSSPDQACREDSIPYGDSMSGWAA